MERLTPRIALAKKALLTLTLQKLENKPESKVRWDGEHSAI